MKENELGSELNPIKNNFELKQAIIGRENCTIYTVNTFKVDEENIAELKLRNITLIGIAFATVKNIPKTMPNIKNQNLKNTIVDEINKITFDIKMENNQKLKYFNGDV